LLNTSPVVIFLVKEKSAWQILCAGIQEYDLYVPCLFELLSCKHGQGKLNDDPYVGEIVAPISEASLNSGEQTIEWQSPIPQDEVKRLLMSSWESDTNWPSVKVQMLTSEQSSGSVSIQAHGATSAQSMHFAKDYTIRFSKASHWQTEPGNGREVDKK
jgi:hypothetical protein